jgi:hypothetical protein
MKTLRSRRFWTFAIILLAVTVASVVGSSDFRACLRDHAPSANGLAWAMSMPGLTRDCLGEFIHHNGEAIIAFFTIILALSTIALWIATSDAVQSAERASKAQLSHAREVERAYVTGGGDIVRNTNDSPVMPNGKRVFRVDVGNYGKTPAFLRAYDFHFTRLADLQAETTVRPVAARWTHVDRLAPGGHTKSIRTVEVPAGDDAVYGAFWYRDIWQERDYEFRFILSLSADRSRPNVTGVHPDYEKSE